MYFQQQPTFLEGLISGFMQQRDKNNQQRQEQKQADILANAFNQTDQQNQPQLPPPVNQGLLAAGAKSLMPSTNFAPQLSPQQQPDVNNLGAGLLNKQTPQQTITKGLFPSTSFNMNPQPQDQSNNDQQAQFDAAVKANPEWYRKGVSPNSLTYVGDRPDISKDATVTASGNVVDLSSPQKPTIQESLVAPNKSAIRQMYSKQMGANIKELTKNGMPLKDAIALMQNSLNQKVEDDFSSQAETYAQKLDSQLDPLMGLDFQTSGNKSKFIATLAKYNQGMKRIGREGADIGLMKELMGQGDVVMQKEDNGGSYRYVMVKKNGERFDDGSFMMPVPGNAGEWTNKVASPEAQLSAETARRGQDLSYAGTMAGINARSAASGVAGGNTSQKMSMYKWASGYSLQPTGEYDALGKPVMTRVQNNPQLAAQLAQELGYGGQGGGRQQTREEQIAAARAAGYTDEQIQEFLGGGAVSQPQPAAVPQPVYQPINTDELLRYGVGGD